MNDYESTVIETVVGELIERYPPLGTCRRAILDAGELLVRCYIKGGTVLTCGNGGSAADSSHIVGELMKGFRRKRPVSQGLISKLSDVDPDAGEYLGKVLQQALPAIDLTAQTALTTAFSNDQAADAVFAQQLLGYSRPENLLIALSTSGNSKNVIYAAIVARALGLSTIAMTGSSGGALGGFCDVTIAVPEAETAKIQELHLPIYHALCSAVEAHFYEL